MKWLAMLLLAASPAWAQTPAAGLAHGRALAETWCAHCHIVGPEARQGGDAAPSFASIAARAPLPDALRSWLSQRHRNAMPNYNLTPAEIDDLIGYLLSLRR